jgi:predicted DNA-binding mobile mystery protein A
MSSKSLATNQLDVATKTIRSLPTDLGVRSGWIAAVLQALGMPARVLAQRLRVAPAQVTRAQQREMSGAITLASLRRIADALECDVMYALVPREGSFQGLVQRQAEAAATVRLAEVEHTMRLEQQLVDPAEHHRQLTELTEELVRTRPAWMWDVPRRG